MSKIKFEPFDNSGQGEERTTCDGCGHQPKILTKVSGEHGDKFNDAFLCLCGHCVRSLRAQADAHLRRAKAFT